MPSSGKSKKSDKSPTQEKLKKNPDRPPGGEASGKSVNDEDRTIKPTDQVAQGSTNLNTNNNEKPLSSRSRRSKKFSCKHHGCETPDNKSMVCCDECNAWFHFKCVGVDRSVSNRAWVCDTCKEWQEKASVRSRRRKQLELESIEEEKLMRDKRMEEERQLKLKRVEEERLAKEKIDQEYLAQRKKSDELFLNSKIELDSSLGSSQDSRIGSVSNSSRKRTENWIREQRGKNVQSKPTGQSTQYGINNVFVPRDFVNNIPANVESTPAINVQRTRTKNRIQPPVASYLPSFNPNRHDDQIGIANTFHIPDMSSHFTARQVLGKIDLPLFSGDPLDWPMFISSFNQTTEQCCYNNTENLLRLQKSLRGEALELVRSSLIYSDSIPSVIQSLRQMYGQPETILSRLISRIRAMPEVKSDRFDMLIRFSIEAKNLYATIVASQLSEHLNNPMLRQELVEKLPSSLKLSWGFYRQQRQSASLASFNEWLASVAEAASLSTPEIKPLVDVRENVPNQKKTKKKAEHLLAVHNVEVKANVSSDSVAKNTCSVCKSQSHEIDKCATFLDLSPGKRIEKIADLRLCRTCLKIHSSYCNVSKRCGVDGCRRFHHSLLHKCKTVPTPKSDNNPPIQEATRQNNHQQTSNSISSDNSPIQEATRLNNHQQTSHSILYRIVPVFLFGPRKCVSTFAMFDEGSSITLLEESMAQELELEGPESDLRIKWTGEISRVEENSKQVSLEISGIHAKDSKYCMHQVSTVKNLDLPTQSISCDIVANYRHLQNISVSILENSRPTILIGLDQYKLSLPLEVCEGTWEEPVATKTRLGWTICGVNRLNKAKNVHLNIHTLMRDRDHELHTAVKEFFSLENFGVHTVKRIENKDDERANEIMLRTTRYINGRYETGLLWRNNKVELPSSREMALKRLYCFEKKLLKDPDLKVAVNEKINDYLAKNYAEILNGANSTQSKKLWYLPVFAVRNPNKPAKLRLVWDAAAKSNGISLNDCLLSGPDLMSPLLEVLFRFREKRIAISGDLKEMFHQVVVAENDRDAQRFLWRNCDVNKKPNEYVMRVMTFGATCSPSLAQYVKKIHAEKYVNQYPRAVRAIQSNHYVDDWLDSFDTHEEAIRVAKEVRMIHSTGGFEIRNWLCNDGRVLSELGEEHYPQLKNLSSFEGSMDKVLGMWWCTSEDMLVFGVNLLRVNKEIMEGSQIPTKRQALSIVMSTFDPLGLIASFIVHGKMILQDVWRQGTNWDDMISEAANVKWKMWIQRLRSIEQLRIPRSYLQQIKAESDITYDLHIFTDASEGAYSAIAYLRAYNCDSPAEVECTLISSKTRVAPQKPTSIPRLELLAAVLGVRLLHTIINAHSITFNSRTIWTDSSTVLSWIRSDARCYKPFVALRVSECLETTDVREWRYVPSKLNVADEATKWFSDVGLTTSRWFDGPDFLRKDNSLWPKDIALKRNDGANEMRSHLNLHTANVKYKPTIMTVDITYSQSWTKLVRAQAYFEQAVKVFKFKEATKFNGLITCQSIKNAEITLFKRAQWDTFKDEVSTLTTNPESKIDASSSIFTYSPYVDERGLVRVKGRIDKSCLPTEVKRPIILPKNHEITFKIIAYYHRLYLHQNHETVINEIRQRFAIPQLRVIYRRIRSNCQICKVNSAKPRPPEMAELPTDRLAVNLKPFTNVGIDYFGPLDIVVGRRVEKRYGVLYTCLSIRAIHLELVNSLTTDSCIRSLIMFMARRGTPRRIYTDNGTNFRGANNVLQAELRKLKLEDIANKYTNIEWRFIPPASPHFGGAWERLVRVVKSNLLAALPDRKPCEEILRTCFAEVEIIVNSRPLTHIPIDAEDAEAITPNHLLLGTSSGAKPLCASDQEHLPTSKSWRITQMFADRFWKRFIREYLPDLVRRTKWYSPVKPIAVDDLVFIVDDRNVRGNWPRGKVIDVMKGSDGQVRSAVIQTSTGLYTRPAVKLAIIDVESEHGRNVSDGQGTFDQEGECHSTTCDNLNTAEI